MKPSQFYIEYRKAFDAAKKVEDILPFMSAATRKQGSAHRWKIARCQRTSAPPLV